MTKARKSLTGDVLGRPYFSVKRSQHADEIFAFFRECKDFIGQIFTVDQNNLSSGRSKSIRCRATGFAKHQVTKSICQLHLSESEEGPGSPRKYFREVLETIGPGFGFLSLKCPLFPIHSNLPSDLSSCLFGCLSVLSLVSILQLRTTMAPQCLHLWDLGEAHGAIMMIVAFRGHKRLGPVVIFFSLSVALSGCLLRFSARLYRHPYYMGFGLKIQDDMVWRRYCRSGRRSYVLLPPCLPHSSQSSSSYSSSSDDYNNNWSHPSDRMVKRILTQGPLILSIRIGNGSQQSLPGDRA
ncbi:hypothetical protein Tco_0191102 [Tanacetum coccineum]